jgi:glutathione-regulated potassium-efflux system protein KefB
METRKAWRMGLLLSQGGEFGFVLFAAAQGAMLITPEAASLFGAIVTLSMASTPFLMMFNKWSESRASLRDGAGMEGPEKSDEARAIIVGYGRFGQTVGQMLMAKGISLTLIDSKPSQIELSESFGMKVYYGDGTRIDLLRAAGAAEARALLFCVDGATLDKKKMEPILQAFPQAAVYVRVFDRRQLIALDGIDVAGTYREVFEAAVLMGRDALHCFCVGEEEVQRVEREFRHRDAERLAGQTKAGDLHNAQHLMFRPDRALPDREGEEEAAPG